MRILLAMLAFAATLAAAEPQPYQPLSDARASYPEALDAARSGHKHLWIVIGEAGCPACERLHWFIEAHPETSGPLHRDFVPLQIALSRQNIPLLRAWGSPHLEHGVPVVVVLNTEEKILAVTPSKDFIARVGEFSVEKLAAFLAKWAPAPVRTESNRGTP